MKKLILTFVGLLISASMVEAQFSIAKPVLEDFTGTWCGWCPGGTEIIKELGTSYPNAIAIGVHIGDGMEIADGATVDDFFNSFGYPSGAINRTGGSVSMASWKSQIASETVSSVGISFKGGTYDAATGDFTVDVEGMFTGNETGDLRWNLYVLEDGIIASQENYYSGDPAYDGHPIYGPLFSLPGTISGYEHGHVLRASVGGPWGFEGSIAESVSFGTKSTYTFSGTMSTSWDLSKVHFVATVQKYGAGINDRRILNGEEIAFEIATGRNDDLANALLPEVKIYPNPSTDVSRISFNLVKDANLSVEVMDIMGNHVQTIAKGHQNTGWHTHNWDVSNLANGLYMVKITTDEGISLSRKVMVMH